MDKRQWDVLISFDLPKVSEDYLSRLNHTKEIALILNDEKEELNKKSKYNRLIQAHCYFGLKPNSPTQDSLQHLKCDCGGSTGVLKFLLRELESYSNENIEF